MWLLTDVRRGNECLGLVLAFANCVLFMLYVVRGHRIARDGGAAGIDRLGSAMLVALVVVTPIGLSGAVPAFAHLLLLAVGMAVGICSSVAPYVWDQLAMARLPRATFALLLSLLPASAAIVGAVVLRQIPQPGEGAEICLVVCANMPVRAFMRNIKVPCAFKGRTTQDISGYAPPDAGSP